MSQPFVYLSLGAGVQSTALLVCSTLGLHGVPRAEAAIFADTGDEPAYVYRFLGQLEEWTVANRGPRIIRAEHPEALGAAFLASRARGHHRSAAIPLFTVDVRSAGMMPRQCTREFKVERIRQQVRELLGYKRGERVTHAVTAMIGISIDEVGRMRPARDKWQTNTFPLIDAALTREDCLRIVVEAGLPRPERSACVFCPYHGDDYWKWLQQEHPTDFEAAVIFDRAIRVLKSNVDSDLYVHRSLKPLDQVDFDPHRDQVNMFENECEGMCGV